MDDSNDVSPSKASSRIWILQRPPASIEKIVLPTCHIKRTENALFSNMCKSWAFLSPKSLAGILERHLEREKSKTWCSCEIPRATTSRGCISISKQYKSRQEEEQIDKEGVEKFTEFCKMVLKRGGYAFTLADLFVFDEWILTFRRSTLIIIPYFNAFVYDPKRFWGDMSREFLGTIFNMQFLVRFPGIHPENLFHTLHQDLRTWLPTVEGQWNHFQCDFVDEKSKERIYK